MKTSDLINTALLIIMMILAVKLIYFGSGGWGVLAFGALICATLVNLIYFRSNERSS